MEIQAIRNSRASGITVALLLATGGLWACSSSPSPSVDPFEVAEERDILDDPVERGERRRRAPAQRAAPDDEEVMFIIPEALSEPARTIDANDQGWDLSRMRAADSARHVFDGAQSWDGPDDASFRAAVDVDDSFVYVWVEVTDDQVVPSLPTSPLDAVVVWLRDPRLETLLETVPSSLRDHVGIETEVGVVITPDGQYAPVDSSHSIPRGAIHTATRSTPQGYIVEAAFAAETLPTVGSLPLPEIAVRIDLLDADDDDASQPKARLTAFPGDDGEPPRFASADTPGLLPSAAPSAPPPRPDAWGIWRFADGGWAFQPLEYLSQRWHLIDDNQSIEEALASSDEVPSICTDGANQMRTIEAYQQPAGTYRVATTLCGQPSQNGRCSTDSRTQLIWTALRPGDDGQWSVQHAQPVFDRPLQQCTDAAPSGKEFVQNFSLLPFDVIGSWVFGVGWHKSFDLSDQRLRETAVTLVDPRSSNFIIGQTRLRRHTAAPRTRTLYDSRAYLTDLEGDGRMDLCQVEEVREQNCQALDVGCHTRERGVQVLTQIHLWDNEGHRFSRYPMDRYGDCRGSMTFDNVDGYKILLIGNRLGLLRSPERVQ